MNGFEMQRIQQAVRRQSIAAGHRPTYWAALVLGGTKLGSRCKACGLEMWWATDTGIAGPLSERRPCVNLEPEVAAS